MTISTAIPRTALVTGGARRLGRAIALALADAGFDIVLHYASSAQNAEHTAEAITAKGRRVELWQADLSREEQVALPATKLGPIGVLVNNASVFERDEWNTATRSDWDMHLETNLRAPFRLMQEFARQLPPEAQGAVINMLDERVWSLTPHFVSYTVSKSALWTLTQTMALALAPRIRVNGIGPGPALPSARQTEAQFAQQCATLPLQHGTNPAEVAQAALMILALPSMTGQMIALDGGQHLQWSPARTAPIAE